MTELSIRQAMRNEQEPIGPERYFLGNEEISRERYDELLAQWERNIEAGRCGIVD